MPETRSNHTGAPLQNGRSPALQGHQLSKRTLAASAMILVAIPLLLWLGVVALNDRHYYLIGILIILCTSLPFFLVFEHRKPKAREMMLIAVLAAIAVAGRAAFFMVPQFKPVVAVVIIAGVSFGGEAGFLVGALAGFISNFYFGHGPWTPWQMFSFGIIGFLAGVLFQTGKLKKNRLPLCLFGGLSTLVIYGGLMNLCSLFIFSSKITWASVKAIYLSGLPFDLVHAASTVIFLLVLSETMLEKLDRVKIKYGLIEPDTGEVTHFSP